MVIPQFSIRLLMLVTAVVAVLAMIASWGGQGIAWAIGATAALGMFALTMLVQAALFGLIWLLSPLVRRRDDGRVNLAAIDPPQLQSSGDPILATQSPPLTKRPN